MQSFANILLLSGPSGGGKSTFAALMRQGGLPEDIQRHLSPGIGDWPVIDVTNGMRREIEARGEAAVAEETGAPARFILHYDITTVYRSGLGGYARDPALRLLRLARAVQVVFVCPDAQRLFTQFTVRDAARQARKPGLARAWNRAVLGPVRRFGRTLKGEAYNAERSLYSDPGWLEQCYSAWEAYIMGLVAGGTARDVLRIEPRQDQAREPAFRIVPQPRWPVFSTGNTGLR
jgi:hypothetical protein